MTQSSFYADGEVLDAAVVESNDVPASIVPSQAPSGFYPDGTIYTELADSAEVVGDAQAAADAAAASAAAAAASAASFASYAPLASPALTGNPTAPTAAPGDNDTSIATTAFVQAAVVAAGSVVPATANPLMDGTVNVGVSAKYAREDHVHPTDTSRADAAATTTALGLKAPSASPALTGTPTAPTATANTNTTQIATTAYADAADAILAAALLLKAPLASPALTGTPTAPTATAGTNTTQLATTAFVDAARALLQTAINAKADTSALALKADLASPTLTGTPKAPTATPGTNTTQLATTAFVEAARVILAAADALKAPLASPALTGTPTAPTATAGTNTTQLATTAFVLANAGGGGGGTPGNPTASVGLAAVNGAASTYMRSDAAPALSLSISPTWTGVHAWNNPIKVGTAPTLSSVPSVVSAQVNTGSTNAHGFAENSTYNFSAAGLGVASFDGIATFTGTQTYDHVVTFQSRPTYGSSGAIQYIYGSYDQPTINGPAVRRIGHDVEEPLGTGTITTQYGYYCETLTKATNNWAFYSNGSTPSKFGGNVDVGSLSVGGSDVTGAWTAYTPSVSAGSGAFTTTSSTGRYKRVGQTVFFTASVSITTNGTAAGWITLGLPLAFKSGTTWAFNGIRSGTIAVAGISSGTATVDIVDYNAAYPGANGRTIYISGSYEAN